MSDDYYLAGGIEPSSGATFYVIYVTHGGCSYVWEEPTSAFGVLTDAKPGYDDVCVGFTFDDLRPLFSGGGNAVAAAQLMAVGRIPTQTNAMEL
jgi:hypothetical protein